MLGVEQENLAGAEIDRHHLDVVEQRDIAVLQQVVEELAIAQRVVQAVVENGAVVQDVLQDADVILIQHVVETDELDVAAVQRVGGP